MTIHIDLVEFIGVLGTLFILLAFTRNSAAQIRIINSIGSVLFVIYGLRIGALSVWLLNGICIIINIYKLVGIYRTTKMHQNFQRDELDLSNLSEFEKLTLKPDVNLKDFVIKKRENSNAE